MDTIITMINLDILLTQISDELENDNLGIKEIESFIQDLEHLLFEFQDQ